MKNTVLKYKTEQIGKYKVRDYFSKEVHLHVIKERYPELSKFFIKRKLGDNGIIEGIANELYSNPNLWDFLLLINDKDPLFGLPYGFDVLAARAENRLKEYLKQLPKINITEERKQELYEQFLDEIVKENEGKREFEMVDPSKISSVITKLRQDGII